MQLWEILIPKYSYDDVEWEGYYHKEWDERILAISGGMTILRSAKGVWVSPNGNIITERMIPVRLTCNRKQIEDIVDFTKEHYGQQVVMAYKVSDEVIIR